MNPRRGGRLARERLAGFAAWALAGLWAAWALVRLLGLESGFPLNAMLAFTPYVAAAALIPIAVALALGRRAAAALAALAAVVLAASVLPRAFGGPSEAEGSPGPTLRVLAANMMLGKGDPEALVALVDELDVDLLSVEELTPALAQDLDEAGLRALLPERLLATGTSSFGGGLYSHLGLGAGSAVELPGGFPLLRASLSVPGAPELEVYGVHTQPPTRWAAEWDDDLRALPGASESPLRILLGDFNATLDHDKFRELLERGYDDAAETLGAGLTATWPEHRRFPPLVAIDHVLADERIGIRDFSAHEVDDSDHRAVYAELELPAG